MSFGFIASTTLYYLAFLPIFRFWAYQTKVFQKRVVRTKFDIYVFIIYDDTTLNHIVYGFLWLNWYSVGQRIAFLPFLKLVQINFRFTDNIRLLSIIWALGYDYHQEESIFLFFHILLVFCIQRFFSSKTLMTYVFFCVRLISKWSLTVEWSNIKMKILGLNVLFIFIF
jgi:hypothetical protein